MCKITIKRVKQRLLQIILFCDTEVIVFEVYYNPEFLLVYIVDNYTPDIDKILCYNKKFLSTSFTLEDVFVEFHERKDAPRSISVGDIIVDSKNKKVFMVDRCGFKSVDFPLP